MEAELHDGRILEFPDGTDPAVIQETVKRVLSQSPQTGVRETTEETEVEETQTPSSITQPVTQQQPDQDQPMFTMDDLNTNKNWIDNARIIYRIEEGEDAPKKTDKQLAEWLKNRHSEVGVDLTSMAWLASNADDFDPEVQKAWKDSMDMYENTDWDTMSFFRAAKNMIQDPTMIAGTVGTLGLGGVARIAGGKTASMLGKYAIKEQLKNALMKRGLTEAAAKEAAEKGATKGLKSQVLSDARREALRKVGQRQAVTGGLAGAGYEGSADAMLQDINIDLKFFKKFRSGDQLVILSYQD